MPAGVTASNIRSNRKKINQQQGAGIVGSSDSTAHNDISSLNGSHGAFGGGAGGKRRVGIN